MRQWMRLSNEGWLEGKPAYMSDQYYIAQDYDDLDDDSEKLMWFLHDEKGMLGAFKTLREAKAYLDG